MDVLGAPQGCDVQSVRVISHKTLAFEGPENAGQPTSTTQHTSLVSYRLTKWTQRRAQRPIGFILDRTGRRVLPKEARPQPTGWGPAMPRRDRHTTMSRVSNSQGSGPSACPRAGLSV